jgi:hypothetical protein
MHTAREIKEGVLGERETVYSAGVGTPRSTQKGIIWERTASGEVYICLRRLSLFLIMYHVYSTPYNPYNLTRESSPPHRMHPRKASRSYQDPQR